MNKMPKMEELTTLVETVKMSVELQELMSIVAFDAKEKEMLDRRILLTKQWIGQIVVPAATVAVTAMTIPEVRQMIAAKADSVKYKIKSKINKREA